jgi:hypothetical protein
LRTTAVSARHRWENWDSVQKRGYPKICNGKYVINGGFNGKTIYIYIYT